MDDVDGDQSSDHGSDMDVDPLAQKTTVDVSQPLQYGILGEMLLRQEFLDTRDFIESYVPKNPTRGLVITGQHRVGSRTQKGLALLKRVMPLDHPWYYFLVVPAIDPDLVTLTLVDEKWAESVQSFQLIVLDMHVA